MIWQRLLRLLRIKTGKALDAAEDPRETLDYSYERQRTLLRDMKRGIADVATARKRLENQSSQLRESAEKLEGQARRALGQGREDLAREALTRRAGIATELRDLEQQESQLRTEEDKMVEGSRRLEATLESLRTRKETMKATYTAAEAQTRVGESATGMSDETADLGRAMERAEDKIAQMQARSGALEELMASGALEDLTGSSDRIQAELDMMASGSEVDAELTRLKNELDAGDRPALDGGEPSEDPRRAENGGRDPTR